MLTPVGAELLTQKFDAADAWLARRGALSYLKGIQYKEGQTLKHGLFA